MDAVTGATTPVACDVGPAWNVHVSHTDLIWEDK